ncbi:hypothetical protein ABIE09_002321 [Lysobacter enzymogenes]|uniref:trypsin-like serine peptidase n=1 Tax=Lysobacter enzymogenes TaxID=69 RepID=UPI0033940394
MQPGACAFVLGLSLWSASAWAQPAVRDVQGARDLREAVEQAQRARLPALTPLKPKSVNDELLDKWLQPRPSLEPAPQIDLSAPRPALLPDAEIPGLQLSDLLERRKNSEMPLPGATGTPPALLGTAAGALYARWQQCQAAGRQVLDAGCQLKQGECSQLKQQYGTACFTPVGASGFALGGGKQAVTVPGSVLERVLAVLMIDATPACNGVFLDPSHVLTAAHCRDDIDECRAKPGGCAAAFVRLGPDPTRYALAQVLTDQYDDTDPASDFDIWKLDRAAAGVAVLPALKLVAPNAAKMRMPASVIGAARFVDCADAGAQACAPPQLYRPADATACSIVCRLPSGALLHECQTLAGLSGAPLLVSDNGKPAIAGLHTRLTSGFASAVCPGENQIAVSMTRICAWIDQNHPELGGMCHAQ